MFAYARRLLGDSISTSQTATKLQFKPGDLVVQRPLNVYSEPIYYRVIGSSVYGEKFTIGDPKAVTRGDKVCLQSIEQANAYAIRHVTLLDKVTKDDIAAERERISKRFDLKINCLVESKERLLSALEEYASSQD